LSDDDAPDETPVNDVLNVLLGGVLDRRLMRFVYLNGLSVVGRRLASPQAAAELATLSDTEANRVDLYAAERFEAATQLSSQFRPPAAFQLAPHISGFGIHDIGARGPLQTVVVEFSKARARYASNRRWHRDQTLHQLPDGRVRIEFPCRNLAPIVSWVLEWGPHARAIEPAALVERVVRELAEAHAQYR
jgi:predicted DNA-binding transcriptional regulator YafY